MKRFIILLLLNCAGFLAVSAKDLVQFSGYVRDAETNAPMPFCALYIQGENRGTITGLDGFFNFVAEKGDTILVKYMNYKPFRVVIPNDLDASSFSKDITLERDPVSLPNLTVKPLPETLGQLRQKMILMDIPDNLQELARNTIEQSILTDQISRNTKFDGNENFTQYVKSQVDYYYSQNGNQHPSISLTDPFKWASFIKDIKAKKKKKEADRYK